MKLQLLLVPLLAVLLAPFVCVAQKPEPTPIEFSPDLKHPGYLGTVSYAPTAREKPFFQKLTEEERVTLQGKDSKFSLQGHHGKSVSWFGIVREIMTGEAGRITGLRIENKYSTGLSDAHLQTISFNGGGDFRVQLSTETKNLLPLVLVRVYGTVTGAEQGLPVVKAEYVRVWHWFQFNFMEFGEDHSNPEWRKRIDLKGARVYSSRVSPTYYVERLGATDEEQKKIRAYHEKQEPAAPAPRKK
jgi:hypothetical protein